MGIVHQTIPIRNMIFVVVLSILMNLAATPDDVLCITQCGMLRALLEATGCRLRASIGAVSPRRLPWSSILLCRADGHKTQLLASTYHTKRWTDQLGFCANQRIIEDTCYLSTIFCPSSLHFEHRQFVSCPRQFFVSSSVLFEFHFELFLSFLFWSF